MGSATSKRRKLGRVFYHIVLSQWLTATISYGACFSNHTAFHLEYENEVSFRVSFGRYSYRTNWFWSPQICSFMPHWWMQGIEKGISTFNMNFPLLCKLYAIDIYITVMIYFQEEDKETWFLWCTWHLLKIWVRKMGWLSYPRSTSFSEICIWWKWILPLLCFYPLPWRHASWMIPPCGLLIGNFAYW